MRTLQRVPSLQILIAAILAVACASVPGERWTGLSTGEGSGCHPLKLILHIRGDAISGYALMETGSVTLHWDATGKVRPGNAVVVTTTTGDPSISGNVIRWEGTLTESALTLRQPSSLRCREPRSAVLTRSSRAAASLVGGAVASPPLPRDVRIVPPASIVPQELAAFSGKWAGTWAPRAFNDKSLHHVLVVEEVGPVEATAVYAYGLGWYDTPGWVRVKGQFVGSVLRLGPFPRTRATATYRMLPDGTLDANWEEPSGLRSRATMTRTKE